MIICVHIVQVKDIMNPLLNNKMVDFSFTIVYFWMQMKKFIGARRSLPNDGYWPWGGKRRLLIFLFKLFENNKKISTPQLYFKDVSNLASAIASENQCFQLQISTLGTLSSL